jgi:DNA invertase Pin-like site-specific DNA recombinase
MGTTAYSYIRFSSRRQAKGDSLRRQLEASRKYAAKRGWSLVEDYADLGVSGYTGSNVKDGDLGRFLAAVRSGKIKSGSALIVEHLDRLSRQPVRRSAELFLSIVNAGITLVTLADDKVYDEDNCDIIDIMTSVITLSGSHAESQKKSMRLAEVWRMKRERAASGVRATSNCPAWLRASGSGFEIIPERAVVVRRIFSESASGVGVYSIAKRLNSDGVRTLSGRSWRRSSVLHVLTSRAVLGEYQPGLRRGDGRARAGDPIIDYYPRVIDDELWNRVRAGMKSRRRAGGRRGTSFTNVFSSLVRCSVCGGRVGVERGKGGRYLVCEAAAYGSKGSGCRRAGWHLPAFERTFLLFMRELDLTSVMADGDASASRDQDIEVARGELVEVERMTKKTLELLEHTDSPVVGKRINELEEKKKAIEARIREMVAARDAATPTNLGDLKRLIDEAQRIDGKDTFMLRAAIASRVRSLVDSIVMSSGSGPVPAARIDEVAGDNEMVRLFLGETSERWFAVRFKSGVTKLVVDGEGPLRFIA